MRRRRKQARGLTRGGRKVAMSRGATVQLTSFDNHVRGRAAAAAGSLWFVTRRQVVSLAAESLGNFWSFLSANLTSQ